MDHRDICLIGGDRRIAYMAPIFLREGCRVICHGTYGQTPEETSVSLREVMDGAGTIVCGIPFEKDGLLFCEGRIRIPLPEFQRCLRKHQKVFGGVLPEAFRRHCEERSIEWYDFMKDEPLTLYNAVATAEGAILEALSHKETLLHQSNSLVLGFGRCGSLIAQRLAGLRASVCVTTADPAELAMAQATGYLTFPLDKLPKNVSRFDYIFNTIPACCLGENCLPQVRQESLIIDLASGAVGVDYEMAKTLSLSALFCPGLPGKYAAKSCAERLVKYVLSAID